MIALADFANDEGESWPSIDTLGQRAECSRRSVQEHLAILTAHGDLAISHNAGPRGCNLYRIIYRPADAPAGGANPARGKIPPQAPSDPTPSAPAGGANPARGGANPAPPIANDGRPGARGGANDVRPGAPKPSGTVKEPGGRGEQDTPPPALAGNSVAAAILKNLLTVFPDSPPIVAGRERQHLEALMPFLVTLTLADWQTLTAYMQAPNRMTGRVNRWPRDRAEALEHFGQFYEAARKFWRTGGERWWTEQLRRRGVVEPDTPDDVPPPEPDDFTDGAEAMEFFRNLSTSVTP